MGNELESAVVQRRTPAHFCFWRKASGRRSRYRFCVMALFFSPCAVFCNKARITTCFQPWKVPPKVEPLMPPDCLFGNTRIHIPNRQLEPPASSAVRKDLNSREILKKKSKTNYKYNYNNDKVNHHPSLWQRNAPRRLWPMESSQRDSRGHSIQRQY